MLPEFDSIGITTDPLTTLILMAAILMLAQTVVLVQAGLLDGGILQLSVGGIIIALAALAAGMALRDRVDADTYRGWLRKVLWVIVVVLVSQYGHTLFNG